MSDQVPTVRSEPPWSDPTNPVAIHDYNPEDEPDQSIIPTMPEDLKEGIDPQEDDKAADPRNVTRRGWFFPLATTQKAVGRDPS
jgi:hypothetical protein